jgi:hypothetical protein
MSSSQASTQSNDYSLYIPTLNKKYSAEIIINIFWKFFIGNVDRIDFVPIMKQPKDPKKEPFEDSNFWQAFIYVRPNTTWAKIVMDAIDTNGSYRFYPNQKTAYTHFSSPSECSTNQPNPNEYWVILKNNNPVPYTQTHLNVHQLAHNNTLLEAKASELEAKASEMELEMAALKAKLEDMKQDVARLQYDNDTMSMQLSEAAGRTRSDSHSTTESEAESFVNSLENILRMAEERQGVYSDENGNYEEYSRQRMYEVDDVDNDGREREEDLVYDDSGEMTPRGWKVSIEVELETCSECGLKCELVAYGCRNPNDNLCGDCVNLTGMDKYEC